MKITIDLDEKQLYDVALSLAAQQVADDIHSAWRGRECREFAKEAIKSAVDKNEKMLLESACIYAGDKIVRDGKKAGLISLKDIIEQEGSMRKIDADNLEESIRTEYYGNQRRYLSLQNEVLLEMLLSKIDEASTIGAGEPNEYRRGRMVKSLNEWANDVHKNAKEHGWHDTNREFPEVIALCHSELSEALEEYRAGNPMYYERHGKPEGIATEMIDCIIRILDWCGQERIDVDQILKLKHNYNVTRPYRHGNKKC